MLRKTVMGLMSLSVLVLIALLAGQLSAQSISGTISGTLADPSGAVIPATDVTLTNEATGQSRTTVSSDAGEFVFTALQPGSYALKIEKAGFRGFNRKGILLTASERVGLGRIQLEVGELSNTVNVTLAGETVTTESADTAATLSTIQLDNVTTKGRDVMNLLRTLPGVTKVAV